MKAPRVNKYHRDVLKKGFIHERIMDFIYGNWQLACEQALNMPHPTRKILLEEQNSDMRKRKEKTAL